MISSFLRVYDAQVAVGVDLPDVTRVCAHSRPPRSARVRAAAILVASIPRWGRCQHLAVRRRQFHADTGIAGPTCRSTRPGGLRVPAGCSDIPHSSWMGPRRVEELQATSTAWVRHRPRATRSRSMPTLDRRPASTVARPRRNCAANSGTTGLPAARRGTLRSTDLQSPFMRWGCPGGLVGDRPPATRRALLVDARHGEHSGWGGRTPARRRPFGVREPGGHVERRSSRSSARRKRFGDVSHGSTEIHARARRGPGFTALSCAPAGSRVRVLTLGQGGGARGARSG